MNKTILTVATACVFTWLAGAPVYGEETPKPDAPKAETPKKADAPAAEKVDPYKMPEAADSKTLVDFCKGIILQRRKVRNQAQFNEYQAKARPVLETACNKIIELEKGDKTEFGRFARRTLLGSSVAELMKPNSPKAQEYLDELNKFLYTDPMVPEDLELALGVGQALERISPDKAKVYYNKLVPALTSSKNPVVASRAKSVEGTVRRLNLMGNTMTLKGTTTDGKAFDVADWKGKVVLVDFWATWCHFCIEEIPNVKKNYEGYHNKGFEVVGISGDQDRAKLDAYLAKAPLPWTTLHDAGGRNPAMEEYAVHGFPTVFLIGKEGKVISLNARGPELGRLLKEQLGEPEAPKETPADPKAATPEVNKEPSKEVKKSI